MMSTGSEILSDLTPALFCKRCYCHRGPFLTSRQLAGSGRRICHCTVSYPLQMKLIFFYFKKNVSVPISLLAGDPLPCFHTPEVLILNPRTLLGSFRSIVCIFLPLTLFTKQLSTLRRLPSCQNIFFSQFKNSKLGK